MPVRKYRSAEEMPRVERVTDDSLLERIRALWRRAFLLAPPSFQGGVTRFRSIEEANEARRRATIDRMRATRRRP